MEKKNDCVKDYGTEKEYLREFLMDTESLDKLKILAKKENIFEILAIGDTEIRHSNFLSWLLDPSANHNLGDLLLKKLLFEYSDTSENKIDVFEIDRIDLDDCIIYRELYHMDIVIQSRNSDFLLIIENKLYSKERKHQTKEYRERVEKEFADVGKKFFIYLTIDAEEAEDEQWTPMSHRQILSLVKSVVNYLPKESRSRIYVEDYIEVMEMIIGENETELQKICADIYSRHKEAIDILIDNIPDSFHKRAKFIEELIKKDERLELRESNNSFIRFTIPEIINKIGLRGTDEWVSTEDLLLFEVVNNRNGTIRFVLTIGPAKNSDNRIKLLNYLYPAFNNGKIKKKSNKWTRVYSTTFKFDEDVDDYDIIEKKFIEFTNETITKKIMPVINSFTGFEDSS